MRPCAKPGRWRQHTRLSSGQWSSLERPADVKTGGRRSYTSRSRVGGETDNPLAEEAWYGEMPSSSLEPSNTLIGLSSPEHGDSSSEAQLPNRVLPSYSVIIVIPVRVILLVTTQWQLPWVSDAESLSGKPSNGYSYPGMIAFPQLVWNQCTQRRKDRNPWRQLGHHRQAFGPQTGFHRFPQHHGDTSYLVRLRVQVSREIS